MPLYAILVREYFPAKIMGGVFGVVAMISTLGMALGPPVGGWLFDHFGGYGWLYVASSAIGVAGALIAMTVRPPNEPGIGIEPDEAALAPHRIA
jgi:MFS family permease